MDEATEGSQSGSSGDTDDGSLLGVAGEVKGFAGGTDRDVEFVASGEMRQEICGDTDMATLSRERRGIEEGVCECEFGGVCKG